MNQRQAKKVLRTWAFTLRGDDTRLSTRSRAEVKGNRSYVLWRRSGSIRTTGDRCGRWDHEFPSLWVAP